MTEATPQPLPIEEQVKQDPRFQHLIKDESFIPVIGGLIQEENVNAGNDHSGFWLEYARWSDVYIDFVEDTARIVHGEENGAVYVRRCLDSVRERMVPAIESSKRNMDVFGDRTVRGIHDSMKRFVEKEDIFEELAFFFSIIDRVEEKARQYTFA